MQVTKFEPNLKMKSPKYLTKMCSCKTLDLTISKEFIPRKSSDMLRSSAAGGVRGSNSQYYIGSFTTMLLMYGKCHKVQIGLINKVKVSGMLIH